MIQIVQSLVLERPDLFVDRGVSYLKNAQLCTYVRTLSFALHGFLWHTQLQMEQVTYVMTDETLPLPRVIEEMADEVIACLKTEPYFDVNGRIELGHRVTQVCRELCHGGSVPASVAMALEKGLCSLLEDGW